MVDSPNGKKILTVNLHEYQFKLLNRINELTGEKFPFSEIIRKIIDRFCYDLIRMINTFEVLTDEQLEMIL